jgi:hypothetical protein
MPAKLIRMTIQLTYFENVFPKDIELVLKIDKNISDAI